MKKIIYKSDQVINLLVLFAGTIPLTLISNINTLAKDQYSIKDLSNLIRTNECNNCNLEGVDLVNKDLRNAKITNSNLKNANLSGGLLDNINFNGSNLSGSSLKNASIRNGKFTKTITLTTNTSEKTKILTVKGEVKKPAETPAAPTKPKSSILEVK